MNSGHSSTWVLIERPVNVFLNTARGSAPLWPVKLHRGNPPGNFHASTAISMDTGLVLKNAPCQVLA